MTTPQQATRPPTSPDRTVPRHRVALRTALTVLTLTPLLRWATIRNCVPPGRPPRNTCPRCRTPISPQGTLRALGPLARCGTCHQRLGPPPWTLETTTALSVAALAWSHLTGLPLAGYALWAAVGIILTFTDLAVHRLPTHLTYTATAVLLIPLTADAIHTATWHPLARAATAGLALAGALAICALALPGLIHWGDIRYALATGTAAGWNSWLTLYTATLLTTLAAATTGLTLIATKRATLTTQQPQGPYLYAATLTAITLLHHPIP